MQDYEAGCMYESFARVYDTFMDNVPYDQWARDFIHIMKNHGIEDGIVLDLGVSSYQLDEAERGFTYREDAPLDMRMDQRQTLTAKDIVNQYSEQELFHIIRDYGEDGFAKNIAKQQSMGR